MKYQSVLKALYQLKEKGYDPKEVVVRWTSELDENDPDIEDIKLAIMHFDNETQNS